MRRLIGMLLLVLGISGIALMGGRSYGRPVKGQVCPPFGISCNVCETEATGGCWVWAGDPTHYCSPDPNESCEQQTKVVECKATLYNPGSCAGVGCATSVECCMQGTKTTNTKTARKNSCK